VQQTFWCVLHLAFDSCADGESLSAVLCRVYLNFHLRSSQKNFVLFQKFIDCVKIVFFNYTILSSVEISETFHRHDCLVQNMCKCTATVIMVVLRLLSPNWQY